MTPHTSFQSNQTPQASMSESNLGEVASDPGTELDADWPSLAVLSRRYIDQALKHTGGNKTRAADLLGIDRRTLNRILARDRTRKSSHKSGQ
jgi:DNA-binding NtrC family response regulator